MKDHRESLRITASRLEEIAAVCRAIVSEAENCPDACTLAGVGAYLADDWKSSIEAMLERDAEQAA